MNQKILFMFALLLTSSTWSAEHDAGPVMGSTDSFRILNKADYDRLKELQYINTFKAILQTPDSLYVVQSTVIPAGQNRYDVIRNRVINYVLDNDPYDFFWDSPEVLERIRAQFTIQRSTP